MCAVKLVSENLSAQGAIVDETGTFWGENSIELRMKLFCFNYPGDLATDIIRNLGYIGVRSTPLGAHIRLHSANVSETALASVIYWMSDRACRSTVIEYLDDKRPNETLLGKDVAIARLCSLSDLACLNRRVSVKHNDISKVQPHSQLRALTEYWRENSGQCAPHELERLANETTSGRFIRIEHDDNGQFIVQNLGRGLQVPEPKWAESAVGKPVGEKGDLIYFKWVLSTYETAWRSGRPDLAEVKATVMWPTSGLVERHYERLLLPCVDTSGTRYLFSANGRPMGNSGLLSKVG